MSPFRLRPVTLLLAPVVLLATATAARAQTTTPSTTPTTQTTSAPTTTPTTSGGGLLGIFPPPSSTPTTAPAGSKKVPPTTVAGGPTTTSPSPTPGDGVVPPGTRTVVPPDAQRQIDSVRRTGPNNTNAWLAAIQPLVTELGMTPTDAAMLAGGQFPVAGPTTWVDDWLYPRFVPTFHLHQGVDLFAASGTPLRAPFDGTLKYTDGAVGGLAAYVTQSDGTFAYMAHMSAVAPGKANGQAVRQGELVGYVGDSGDAKGGAPHCHFELHPHGGSAVAPKPSVDAWVAAATAAAPQLIAGIRAARNPAAAAGPSASVTAVPEAAGPSGQATVAADPASAAWAAASNPAIGTIDLASSLVAGAADAIAWPTPPAG